MGHTKTPPMLRDRGAMYVTSVSHLCYYSWLHCQGQGRLYCSRAVPLSSFDNVIVSFSITLFSTFTTHNYTDEENDGHQNVIINTTIYSSMFNIINNLMQCAVMHFNCILDVMGKERKCPCWIVRHYTLLVSAPYFTHGKTAHQSLTCDHVQCHMWDL